MFCFQIEFGGCEHSLYAGSALESSESALVHIAHRINYVYWYQKVGTCLPVRAKFVKELWQYLSLQVEKTVIDQLKQLKSIFTL